MKIALICLFHTHILYNMSVYYKFACCMSYFFQLPPGFQMVYYSSFNTPYPLFCNTIFSGNRTELL